MSGISTLVIPFLPACVATLLHWKESNQQSQNVVERIVSCTKKFWGHLPGIQFWTHQAHLRKMTSLQLDILQWQQGINTLIKEGETENNIQRIKELRGWILRAQKDYLAIKTQLQRFKIFAGLFESAPQFILQWSILLHKIYTGELPDWTDPIFWLQTMVSIGSVFVTFTGLTCEMPMLIYETQRPPIRSFSFQYFKVLPLVALNVTPRLFAMIAIGSFFSVEDWVFYLNFGIIYIGLFAISQMIIKYWMMKRYPALKDGPKIIDLGLITSIICPSVIGVFNSAFFFITSLSTTLIHSTALGSLCLIGMYHPSTIFQSPKNVSLSNGNESTMADLSYQEIEQRRHDANINFLQWYTWILVPMLLIFCNSITFCTGVVIKRMNDLYMAVWAIDSNKPELLKPSTLKKLNDLVPGEKDNNSLLQYFIEKNDTISARLIEQCYEKCLDLCQTNKQDKTALMLSCDLALPESVEAFFKIVMIENGIKIGINQTSFFNDCNSALHFAVLSNGTSEAKKQVLKLFWSHANDLQINLLNKNDHGKTPIDILEETLQGLTLLQEFGNPKIDLIILKEALEQQDIDSALIIKNNFVMPLELTLFYAIEGNEEAAIALIKNSHILNLQLNQTGEEKRSLFILACCKKKSKVAIALIDQAVAHDMDIAIDTKDDRFGYTAFIWASYYGLVDVVSKMLLEISNGLTIDFNAKDDLGRTGFIWACIYKQSEVVKLLMAKAESHHIDLDCTDIFDKSAFDRWPEAKGFSTSTLFNNHM